MRQAKLASNLALLLVAPVALAATLHLHLLTLVPTVARVQLVHLVTQETQAQRETLVLLETQEHQVLPVMLDRQVLLVMQELVQPTVVLVALHLTRGQALLVLLATQATQEQQVTQELEPPQAAQAETLLPTGPVKTALQEQPETLAQQEMLGSEPPQVARDRPLLPTGPVKLDHLEMLELPVTSARQVLELLLVILEALLLHHGQILRVLLVTQAQAAQLVTQETQVDLEGPAEPHLIHGLVLLARLERLVTSELLVPLVLAQQPAILAAQLLPTGQGLRARLVTQAMLAHPAMLGLEPHLVDQVEQHQLAGLDLLEQQEQQEILVLLVMQEHRELQEVLEPLAEARCSA